MRLADAQQAFAEALFDRRQEGQALPLFKGGAEAAARRFALYRGNLTGNWEKTLAAAYPVIKALVGDEFFEGLAREYGKAYPSRLGDMNGFGADFPQFLAHFPHVADYPYFPDVAALEWAVHRAHYADNAAPLTLGRLAGLEPERLDQARAVLHPACALLTSRWAIADIWLAHQPGSEQALPEDVGCACHALVVRPQWKTAVLPIASAAYIALSALAQGQSWGAALDLAIESDEQFDLAAHLQLWLQHGVFVELLISDQPV